MTGDVRPLHQIRRPLAKITPLLICLGCGRGDHQDCSGITFKRSGKNRRQPCTCSCRALKTA